MLPAVPPSSAAASSVPSFSGLPHPPCDIAVRAPPGSPPCMFSFLDAFATRLRFDASTPRGSCCLLSKHCAPPAPIFELLDSHWTDTFA